MGQRRLRTVGWSSTRQQSLLLLPGLLLLPLSVLPAWQDGFGLMFVEAPCRRLAFIRWYCLGWMAQRISVAVGWVCGTRSCKSLQGFSWMCLVAAHGLWRSCSCIVQQHFHACLPVRLFLTLCFCVVMLFCLESFTHIGCRTESFLDFMLQEFVGLPLEPSLPPWLPRLPEDMSDSDGWPSFLPTSRRLDFSVLMSATAADFAPRPSSAPVLRLAMMVVVWLASLPKICFARVSLLAFTAAGIVILRLNKLMRPKGGKASKLILQMKAFLGALMLICQRFQVLSHQAWLFFDQLVEVREGSGSIPTTISESAFEPSWLNALGPLVAGPLDECGNPMRNNMIDMSPLLQSPGEVLVV